MQPETANTEQEKVEECPNCNAEVTFKEKITINGNRSSTPCILSKTKNKSLVNNIGILLLLLLLLPFIEKGVF